MIALVFIVPLITISNGINAGDEGGSASDDSDSPKFLPGDKGRTILAFTCLGDPARPGFGASGRDDTPEALTFINTFLNLP